MKLLKILLLICLTLSFSACGDNSDESDWSSDASTQNSWGWLKKYPWNDFSMNIPAAWNVVTDDDGTVPTPKNWSVELAVTSAETTSGFANNLIVLSQDLDSYTTSKEYSIVNNVWAENEYLNYIKLSGNEFEFSDGEDSMMYIFEAKYSAETPVLKFLQTAYVCNTNKAFFLTLALPTSLKDTTKYEELLWSFTCK